MCNLSILLVVKMILLQLPFYLLYDVGAIGAKRTGTASSHEKGSALIVHFRSNAHLRAGISVARFRDYLNKMPICQIPMVCPETAIERSGGRQRFCEIDVRTSVATYRSLYLSHRDR